MKTGTQRDMLVAYWMLFDEFEIGASECVVPPQGKAAERSEENRPRPPRPSRPPARSGAVRDRA